MLFKRKTKSSLFSLVEVTDFQDELTEEEKRLLAELDKEGQPKKHLKTKIKRIFKVTTHSSIFQQRKFLQKSSRMNDDDSSNDEEEEEEEDDDEGKSVPSPDVTPVIDNKTRFFLGKDYSNSYVKDFEFIDKFDEGFSSSFSFIRMN